MADYNSMKVPELKKLLQERSLPASGNKADLIARLQENDKSKETTTTESAGAAEPSKAGKQFSLGLAQWRASQTYCTDSN